MKLSKAQLTALEGIASQKTYLVYCVGGGWHCPSYEMRTIAALKKRGLVVMYPEINMASMEVELTETGRKALEEARNG